MSFLKQSLPSDKCSLMEKLGKGDVMQRIWLLVSALLGLHACLLGWSAWRHSPTHLEIFHLAAGVSHVSLGRFDLYRVNPPLVRAVAALPVMAAGVNESWVSYDTGPRAEVAVGIDMMKANDSRTIWLTTLARWACIPFSLLGGWICFLWARQLYGDIAGVVSCALWCFCPYVLGHGSTIIPDAHAAALGVTAAYTFWLWLRHPTLAQSLLVGVLLGFAELAKFTLLIFYPVWPILWAVWRFTRQEDRRWPVVLREGGSLLLLMAVSLMVVNLGYNFEGSFRPLGDYRFRTRMLTGRSSHKEIPDDGANRFSSTWLSSWPVPLPMNYVQGIDDQSLDLERGIWSYLRGTWRIGGWWYFHLYALSVKLPLGVWALFFMAAAASLLGFHASGRDEFFLLGTMSAFLLALCSQTGIGVHSRYSIPLLPFVFIWISKVVLWCKAKGRLMKGVVFLMLAWAIGDSIYQYPHSLSYFNELAGGPEGGYEHLSDSDSSWGQDLLYLREWLDNHPEASPIHLAHCGPFDPRLAGIDFVLAPVGPRNTAHPGNPPPSQLGPIPGWFAIDVCFLLGGDPLSASDGKGSWYEPSGQPGYDLSYFRRFKRVARAGYSIYIYHITPEEANTVRAELGLPPLSMGSLSGKSCSAVRPTRLTNCPDNP